MFSLLDRIPSGVEPMLTDVETYIVHSGIDDMKASVEIITTVREEGGKGGGGGCGEGGRMNGWMDRWVV